MPHGPTWPPSFDQLLRKQLATGRFLDEADVLAEALRLLEERSEFTVAPADAAFGLWKGRARDGLDLERSLRADWRP